MRFETIRAIAFLWRHWRRLRPSTKRAIFEDMATIMKTGKAPHDNAVYTLRKAVFNLLRLYAESGDPQDYPGQFAEQANKALADTDGKEGYLATGSGRDSRS